MGALEIALLIAGALIFILSFLIPSGEKEGTEDIEEIVREEVKKRMDAEIETLRSHVDDVVDEAVEYAQEKTERSLERITNEKIMAVNEYSDTVLAQINKNHTEVMFLYDMLREKHEDLKETVTEANLTAREARETTLEAAREAEAAAEMARSAASEQEPAPKAEEPKPQQKKIRTLNWAEMALADAEADARIINAQPAESAPEAPESREEFTQGELHEVILGLHEKGYSDVQIARQLNMGVGEVDLIIGIHGK